MLLAVSFLVKENVTGRSMFDWPEQNQTSPKATLVMETGSVALHPVQTAVTV
jgi:hypothetical protein